jgi:hypothetical protein
MVGSCSMNGEKRKAYRLLVGKPYGNIPLGRPRHRWDGVMWTGLVWSSSGQKQVESSCEFGIEPLGSMKCWETIKWPLE